MNQKTIKNEIIFLKEQDGNSEQELKNNFIKIFLTSGENIRAYLAQIRYGDIADVRVSLCLKITGNTSQSLLNDCANTFKSIFSSNEHLDILLLNDKQELVLREVCCPFYTSSNFQIQCPDFYLTSSEGYSLGKAVISCFKRRRMYGEHPDGYMLCDISPGILGQPFGLGDKDVKQIVIASRHKDFSLFPVSGWPCYVHVARCLKNLDSVSDVQASSIDLIAWGELYKNKEDISFI